MRHIRYIDNPFFNESHYKEGSLDTRPFILDFDAYEFAGVNLGLDDEVVTHNPPINIGGQEITVSCAFDQSNFDSGTSELTADSGNVDNSVSEATVNAPARSKR